MRILLGISGGIAAYKTPELIRRLLKQGIDVVPVLTHNALDFVTSLSIETVSGSLAYTDKTSHSPGKILHLELARATDMCVIAPATANIIAKLAAGIADDLLTTTVLSHQGPKIIVPAMHPEMFDNPITQCNLDRLKSYGFKCWGPARGELACGDIGAGRLIDLDLIVMAIQMQALPPLDLTGKRLLISSGGTQESIDPVRVITNRSTGQLGNMIAHLAALSGAQVTLVTTTVPLENPHLHSLLPVKTSGEMQDQLTQAFPFCDALIMAAAVSDFKPQITPTSKVNRQDSFTLELTGTPDILKSLVPLKTHQKMIGFCLATDTLVEVAQKKLKDKSLDWIIANTPDAIGNTHRKMTLINASGDPRLVDLPLMGAAHRILSTCLS